MSDASSTPLTDDEAAMLNWFRQFQTSRYIEGDETVESLIAKQMLFVADARSQMLPGETKLRKRLIGVPAGLKRDGFNVASNRPPTTCRAVSSTR